MQGFRTLLLAVLIIFAHGDGPAAGRPEQIHIAIAGDSSIGVSWATSGAGSACSHDSVVKFGLVEVQLDRWSQSGAVQRLDVRKKRKEHKAHTGESAATDGDTRVTFFHNAFLHHLIPGQTYYYSVGSASESACWSPVYSFRLPDSQSPLTVAMFGDLGKEGDGTRKCIAADAQSRRIDIAIHAGDFAYALADHRGRRGDEFMMAMEQVAARIPYMVSAGNHEADDHPPFLQYAMRFQNMPAASSGALTLALPAPAGETSVANSRFYSFDMGLVHFVAVDTEVYFADEDDSKEALLAERQRAWLRADLTEAADARSERPWIVVYGHRPFYCSAKHSQCEADGSILREQLGQIFHEFGVDLYFCGHVHAYERLFDVAPSPGPQSPPVTSRATRNMKATTYIVSGVAGPDKLRKKFKMEQPDFSAVRVVGKKGYGRLTIYNRTHMHWEQVACDDMAQPQILDSVMLEQHRHGPFSDSSGKPIARAPSSAHKPAVGITKGMGVWGWALGGTLLGLMLGCAWALMALCLTLKLVRARGGRVPASVYSLSTWTGAHIGRTWRQVRADESQLSHPEEKKVFLSGAEVELRGREECPCTGNR